MKNIKKISYCLFSLLALFVITNPVFATNAQGCSDIDVDVKIVNAVHLIILVIQIVIPVLLVVFGSIDFLKAIIAQKDDEIKKGQQTFIKRLIAGIIVFFIIAIVRLVIGFVAGDDDKQKTNILDCFNCFMNGANKTSGVCKK